MRRRQHAKMRSFDVARRALAYRYSGGVTRTMTARTLPMRRIAIVIRLAILGCSRAAMANAFIKHGRVVSVHC